MVNTVKTPRLSAYSDRLLIVLLTACITLPFFIGRVLRVAGDEKVYVAQTLEMDEAGTWFQQRLFGQPDYYKGPLYYILTRIGFLLFGKTTSLAALYQNFIYLALGAVLVASIARRRLPAIPQSGIVAGLWFTLSVGLYSHAFASQMDLGLATFFAGALFLLDRAEGDDPDGERGPSTRARDGSLDLPFWIVAGTTGWLKAPAHSFFLGVAALLYWAGTGQLVSRLKSVRAWAYVVVGIVTCIAGFLPGWFIDGDRYWNTYVLKESLIRGPSGQGPMVAVASTYGFYLFPGLTIAVVAYVSGIGRFVQWLRSRLTGREAWRLKGHQRLIWLGICLPLPSTLLFLWHPYRFENYNLPGISGLMIAFLALYSVSNKKWEKPLAVGGLITGAAFALIGGGVAYIYSRISASAPWLSAGAVGLCVLLFGATAWIWLSESIQTLRARTPRVFSIARVFMGTTLSYFGMGLLMLALGEREMTDLRNFERERLGPREFVYYNPGGNIWNEWGYLNLWMKRRITVAVSSEQIRAAVERGDVFLVAGDGELERFKNEVQGKKFVIHPWKRWRTHGRAPNGQPLFGEALRAGDADLLTRNFYIVESLAE